jgi:hypothetical protein
MLIYILTFLRGFSMKMILKESIDSCKTYESGLNPQRRTTCIYPFETENIVDT